jgi:hypothetical protein
MGEWYFAQIRLGYELFRWLNMWQGDVPYSLTPFVAQAHLLAPTSSFGPPRPLV